MNAQSCLAVSGTEPLLQFWIVTNYVLFSLRVLVHTHWTHVPRNWAVTFLSLVVVFLFCAFCGYALHALPSLAKYTNELHVALGVASTVLWVTTPRTISKMMDRRSLQGQPAPLGEGGQVPRNPAG